MSGVRGIRGLDPNACLYSLRLQIYTKYKNRKPILKHIEANVLQTKNAFSVTRMYLEKTEKQRLTYTK